MHDHETDVTAVQALDDAWNRIYERNERAGFADLLIDDFRGWFADGRTVSKANLMAPSESFRVSFSERSLHVFGPAAVARGRIRIERPEGAVEQRFFRVYAKGSAGWRAVAVQVFPIVESPPA